MNRWSTTRVRGGSIVQAGLNARNRNLPRTNRPQDAPHQAVVLRSYVHDDEDNTHRFHRVTCDAILINSGIPIYRVPVLQRNYGVHNLHGLWVPRGTTRDLAGGTLVLRPVSRNGSPNPEGGTTSWDQLDGDQVLVDYVEGDIDMPVVIGAYDHERSNRQIVTAAGTPVHGEPQATEYYVHHNGTELRINENGDMLIDLAQAYGTDEDEDASAGDGEFRIRVKADRRVTIEVDGEDVLEVLKSGTQVEIHLGEGAAESVILGDAFKTYLDAELQKVNTFWSAVYATHKHTVPMGGSSGPPDTPQSETLSAVPDSVLSDLAKTKKS